MRPLPFSVRHARALLVLCGMATTLLLCSILSAAQAADAGGDKLRVAFVDVEGGQATLFVTPGGESLLIDTGWPGHDFRDADRIAAAAKQFGLSRIDYVLLTHYHDDHVGGVPQLVQRIPVGAFIDHGPNRELDGGVTEHGYAAYQNVLLQSGGRRITAKPGDILPLKGMHVEVISADGALIDKPLDGAGAANSYCAGSKMPAADHTENARSLGVVITFGRLKLLDLGDLTADKERELMCPVNKVGKVDVYIVSHHGWYQSSSPVLVNALHARVAIMDNGETKGGSIPTMETLSTAPGLPDVWQLHYSTEGGAAHNTAAGRIANPAGTDAGFAVLLTGSKDGRFAVVNQHTGVTKSYAAVK